MSVFGELSGTVEECRAILVSEYLMDNKEVLGIFGYTDDSEITVDDRKRYLPCYYRNSLRYTESIANDLVLYTTYLNIGVDGLQALEHYNFQSKTSGQVHPQVKHSILLTVLLKK